MAFWNEYYAAVYQRMTDRFLILTHVCEEMFDGDEKCRHKDPYEDKYDSRGPTFRQEYVKEIHDIIAQTLPDIKA